MPRQCRISNSSVCVQQEEGGVQQETESMRKTMGKRREEEEEGKARKSSEASGRAARFAVELDGLHCFETLIAH